MKSRSCAAVAPAGSRARRCRASRVLDAQVAAPWRAARRASRRVELEEFRLGLDDFLEVETSEEGLGPAFNGTSCAVCHNVPVVGGGGDHRRDSRRGPRCAAVGRCRSRRTAKRCSSCSRPRSHGCQVQLPPEAVIIARRIPIPLFGAGPGRSDSRRDDPGAGRSRRSRRRRHQRPRVDRARHRHRRSRASAASAGRRSTRRCWRSAPMPIATRWASPTICFREELGVGLTPGAVPPLRSVSRPGRSRRSGDAATRHRQLRVVHEVPGAGRPRRRRRRRRAQGRAGVRAHRLRVVSRAGADDRPEPRSRCSIASRCRSSPTCCCTTSAPATTSRRRRRCPRRSARRRCGACGSGGRCCTTAAPRRSKRRSARHGERGGTRTRAASMRSISAARGTRCWRSCDRSEPRDSALSSTARRAASTPRACRS